LAFTRGGHRLRKVLTVTFLLFSSWCERFVDLALVCQTFAEIIPLLLAPSCCATGCRITNYSRRECFAGQKLALLCDFSGYGVRGTSQQPDYHASRQGERYSVFRLGEHG
jgi:hypothetical protein